MPILQSVMEFPMGKPTKNVPSALKHGGSAGTTILPGEDEAAFNKLHHDLSVELAPNGPLEEDIVMAMARLVWRKQNLKIYTLIQTANKRFNTLISNSLKLSDYEEEKVASPVVGRHQRRRIYESPLEWSARFEAASEEALKEMGTDGELVDLANVVTIDNLLNELSLIDRLDGMIDRCIKRLLMVRGVKSLAAPPESSRSPKRLSAA
jgi:hypothetical protein